MGKLADAIEEHKKLQCTKTHFRDEEHELDNKFWENHENLIEACLSDTEDEQDKEAHQWMLDNPSSGTIYNE